MPAAKDPLEDGLYSKFHNLLPGNLPPFSGYPLNAHVGPLNSFLFVPARWQVCYLSR
jgi:hypothetical protein